MSISDSIATKRSSQGQLETELTAGAWIVPLSWRFCILKTRLAGTKQRMDRIEAIYRSHILGNQSEQMRLGQLVDVIDACISNIRGQISEIDEEHIKMKRTIKNKIRKLIELHQTFQIFRKGIRCDESEAMLSSDGQNSPCFLHLLDIGEESTFAIGQLIADFAGIPNSRTLLDLTSLDSLLE